MATSAHADPHGHLAAHYCSAAELQACASSSRFDAPPPADDPLRRRRQHMLQRVLTAACCIMPRFLSVSAAIPYQTMGILASEALALAAMAVAVNATHFVESGTAYGYSTELLARFFESSPLRIETYDIGTSGHKQWTRNRTEETCGRLSQWPKVGCHKGDSFKLIPSLIQSLDADARVVMFVDGPKGRDGLRLAMDSLQCPRVQLAAVHDINIDFSDIYANISAIWYNKMPAKEGRELLVANNSHFLLRTDEPPYRPAFKASDDTMACDKVVNTTRTTRARCPEVLFGMWVGYYGTSSHLHSPPRTCDFELLRKECASRSVTDLHPCRVFHDVA